MIRSHHDTERGKLRAHVVDSRYLAPFLEWVRVQGESPQRLTRDRLGGIEVMVKTEDLRGKVRLRYALRRTAREAEFANLCWLRDHDFRVAPPMAAGALIRGGLPVRQWLVTEFLSSEIEFGQFIAESKDGELRARRLDALAREVARMHASGFVHRDLYPRNLLVSPQDSGEDRPAILDAWRGGPGFGLRGPAWDLGCLLLEPEKLGTEGERDTFLEAYFAARSALRKPVRRTAFMRSVESARKAQLKRLRARASRKRGE